MGHAVNPHMQQEHDANSSLLPALWHGTDRLANAGSALIFRAGAVVRDEWVARPRGSGRGFEETCDGPLGVSTDHRSRHRPAGRRHPWQRRVTGRHGSRS